MLKLSIITINYNNAKGLLRTLTSVLDQTYTDFEYIVIDGGSNDGSKELLEKHSGKISYWVSEPDAGIYNAMNKGILKASGEYILFLNSGDKLVNSTVIKKAINYLGKEDIIYGNGLVNDNNTLVEMHIPKILSIGYFMKSSLCHPSTFIRKKLFSTYGLYNEELKIVADWEFFIKAIILNKVPVKKLNLFLSEIEEGGISRDEKYRQLLLDEIDLIHNKFNMKSMQESERTSKAKHSPVTKFLKLFNLHSK